MRHKKRRIYWHCSKLDDLIREIDGKMTLSEIKTRIELYLKKVIDQSNMENFNSVDGKMILSQIFGTLVQRHAFLREDDRSGFVFFFLQLEFNFTN